MTLQTSLAPSKPLSTWLAIGSLIGGFQAQAVETVLLTAGLILMAGGCCCLGEDDSMVL